jgi:hypothetical protein
MTMYVETVKPVFDKAILGLSRREFRPDPIGGGRYSRMTSIISPASTLSAFRISFRWLGAPRRQTAASLRDP